MAAATIGRSRPATEHRQPALDGLRGLAALLVFFHHTLQIPTGGYLGVSLFFTLSGFLISTLLLAEIENHGTPRIGRFYLRRAVRLVPAFFAMVVLYLGIRFCFAPLEPSVGPRRFLQLLFLSDFVVSVPFLSHVWSLSIEWQFYFIWPLVLAGLMKLGVSYERLSVSALSAACVIWILRFCYGVDLKVDALLLGSSLALFIRSVSTRAVWRWPRLGQCLLVLALVGTLALSFASDYRGTWIAVWVGYAGIPVLCAVMIGCAQLSSGPAERVFLTNGLLAYFGRISYGLYLYHYPVAASMYVRGYNGTAMMLVGLAVSIPLADVSWRYLEAPLLRLERRRTNLMKPMADEARVMMP